MTNGNDENAVHPAGRVPGSGPTVGSGSVAAEEEANNGATQETLEKICPYCRRPWPKETDQESAD
ncbi:MAG: hypothetical protein GY949_18260 [Gammaproteobacteria bacterium]|nr:hypothetical protein [Gammaproteobacteria bacterium]